MNRSKIAALLAVSAVALLLRVIDNPLANLSALGALCLLCGSVVRHPAAVLIPLLVRLSTDIIIGIKTDYGFFPSWPFDYSALAVIFLIGRYVPRRNYPAVLVSGLGATAVYFLLSNFGVWAMWPDTYPRTLAGLLDCYVMAIPFARGTLIGNLVFAPAFFAAWNYFTVPAPSTESPVALQPDGNPS
jgi:hypothetical protein